MINSFSFRFIVIVILGGFTQSYTYAGFNQKKIDSLLLVIENCDDDSLKFEAVCALSVSYAIVNIEISKYYADSAMKVASMENNDYKLARIHHSYGYLHTQDENYKESVKSYLQAIEYWKSVNDSNQLAIAYNNLAFVFALLEDDEKTLEYLLPSIKIKRQLKSATSLALSYLFASTTYLYLNEIDSSFHYANLSVETSKKTKNKSAIARAKMNLGFIYEETGEYNLALEHYLQSYNVFKEGEDLMRLVEVQINLGYLYQKLNLHRISNRYLELAKETVENNNINLYRTQVMAALENNYSFSKNYKEAYKIRKEIISREYSMLSESDLIKIYEIESEYITAEKDQELNLLTEAGQIEEIKLWNKNLLIISLLILVLPLIIVFRIVRIRLRWNVNKRQLELEKEVLQNQMNPHFIFNALNSVQRYYIEGDIKRGNDLIDKFSRLIQDVLNNSRKRFVSLNEEIKSLDRYLELEQVRTGNKFDYSIICSEGLRKSEVFIPPLLFQPFAENSIWHGIIPLDRRGRIEITINKRNDRTLDCRIIDNGIGISKSIRGKKGNLKHESRGLSITRERLGEFGRITYASGRQKYSNGIGTVVVLRVPFITNI